MAAHYINRLTGMEEIELLTLLKSYNLHETAEILGKPHHSIEYYRRKHQAYTQDKINRAINKIEQSIQSKVLDEVDYEIQANCVPKTFNFTCFDCRFVASENNIAGIREHLDKHIPLKKIIEVML